MERLFPYCDFNCKYDCFTVIGILFSFVFVDHLTEKIVIKISVVVQLLS